MIRPNTVDNYMATDHLGLYCVEGPKVLDHTGALICILYVHFNIN